MNKNRDVIITAESTCDIPLRLKEHFGIETIPFYIKTKHGIFAEQEEIRGGNILEYIELGKSFPEVIPPSADEFTAFFSALLRGCGSIVHISQSSTASAAYRNAVEAAVNMDNVYVVDSGQLAAGISIAVLNAAKMAQSGFSAKVIKSETDMLTSSIVNTIIAGKIDYVHHAGIVSGFMGSMCDTFHLKPCFKVSKGGYSGDVKIIDGVESYMEQFVHRALKNPRDIDTSILIINSAGCTYTEIERLKKLVDRQVHFENVYVADESPCLAWVFGRGAYGLVFKNK